MGYEIPWDTVEGIVRKTLEDDYRLAKEELDDFHARKVFLSREDVEKTALLLHHLQAVIEYYGGTFDRQKEKTESVST